RPVLASGPVQASASTGPGPHNRRSRRSRLPNWGCIRRHFSRIPVRSSPSRSTGRLPLPPLLIHDASVLLFHSGVKHSVFFLRERSASSALAPLLLLACFTKRVDSDPACQGQPKKWTGGQ